MFRKSLYTIGVCLVMFVALSCVSPFYGTAMIEKEFHMDAGLAATSFNFPRDEADEFFPYCVGFRGDFEARYGLNKYFGVNGRVGLGCGLTKLMTLGVTGDAALGMQAALPLDFITPAFRLEALTWGVALIPLLGIGKTEWLTLGSRFFLDYTDGFRIHPPSELLECFIGVHPFPRWGGFAGLRWTSPVENIQPRYFTIGVSYKWK